MACCSSCEEGGRRSPVRASAPASAPARVWASARPSADAIGGLGVLRLLALPKLGPALRRFAHRRPHAIRLAPPPLGLYVSLADGGPAAPEIAGPLAESAAWLLAGDLLAETPSCDAPGQVLSVYAPGVLFARYEARRSPLLGCRWVQTYARGRSA